MKKPRKSTSVFEQIGFRPAEAAHLELRSAMMTRLIAEIEKHGLTQSQAARRIGITQPRVSDLMRGKLHLFLSTRWFRCWELSASRLILK